MKIFFKKARNKANIEDLNINNLTQDLEDLELDSPKKKGVTQQGEEKHIYENLPFGNLGNEGAPLQESQTEGIGDHLRDNKNVCLREGESEPICQTTVDLRQQPDHSHYVSPSNNNLKPTPFTVRVVWQQPVVLTGELPNSEAIYDVPETSIGNTEETGNFLVGDSILVNNFKS